MQIEGSAQMTHRENVKTFFQQRASSLPQITHKMALSYFVYGPFVLLLSMLCLYSECDDGGAVGKGINREMFGVQL